MIKNIKINKKALVAIFLSSSLTLGGCEGYYSSADCSIGGKHAHLYEINYDTPGYKNKNIHLYQYIESEKNHYGFFKRKDDYIKLDNEGALKLKAQTNNYFWKSPIWKINDNKEYIDYIKEYSSDNYINSLDYKCYGEIYHLKGTYPLNPLNRFSPTWDDVEYYSKNPDNANATGEKRLKYYTFYGYNLVKTDNGYEFVKSNDYYTIDDVVANCEYIDKIYYHKEKTEDQELIDNILEKNPKVKSR